MMPVTGGVCVACPFDPSQSFPCGVSPTKPDSTPSLRTVACAPLDTAPSVYPVAAIDPGLADRLPRRILVAEDNAINQKVAAAMLRDAGCLVDVANDGQQACEMAADKRYDIILMDYHMPGKDK